MNMDAKIEERLDKSTAGALAISDQAGGLAFKSMGEVMEFSKLMALAQGAVPKHLRQAPGACLAVCVQALGWRMDPFAVANKSYFVNDRLAFEAQLVHAVIEQRAPIKGRIKSAYDGEGNDRQVRLWCVSAEDGETIEYLSPKIGQIGTKNSPLWKADPDQQLHYYAVRAMCRRFFPDVLLGVYTKDEIEDHLAEPRDITPKGAGGFAEMAANARKQAAEPQEPVTGAPESPVDGEVEDAEVIPPDDEDGAQAGATASVGDDDGQEAYTPDPKKGFPMDPEYDEGVKAFKAKKPYDGNPHTGSQGDSWAAGWKDAEKAAK